MLQEQAGCTQCPLPQRVILGIDPGVAIAGYAVLTERQGQLTAIACDVIRTPAHTPLADRLHLLHEQVSVLLTTYHPTEAAMESLFFGKNRKTAIAVAHARGVLMLALNQHDIPVEEFTPNQVKLAVTGDGHAKKDQVGEMVRVLLNLSAVPQPDDAADAAAVAICHAHTSAWRSRIAQAERKQELR
jgi:crossover junction endodeoxyribonuclease RuvC